LGRDSASESIFSEAATALNFASFFQEKEESFHTPPATKVKKETRVYLWNIWKKYGTMIV
jgi:hypothetical protein